jgi:SAM-dependent MidA family methyltransferase
MPDPDVFSSTRDSGVQMNYRNEPDTATLSLRERMVREIGASGPMPMGRYLQLALYHPQLGYYARGADRVGKGGDFFTSVSVGPVFGQLLARRMVREFDNLGRPARWRIMELGANDGRLAEDVLGGMARIGPQALASLEYVICEPLPTMRDVQRERLAGFVGKVRIVASTEELLGDEWPGVVFGNEVLDALPFHWLEWRDGGWRERRIGMGADGRLQPVLAGKPDDESCRWLDDATRGMPLPDGWQCEVRTDGREFLQECLRGMAQPRMIWIDYGFLREDLMQPHRTEGTWRAYRGHRIEPDPWNHPGECDLTAHVDFTGVAEAAEALGGRMIGFNPQGAWLTRLAMEDLASREGRDDPAWVRQFQTLTHPAHLGARFHVMELSFSQSP